MSARLVITLKDKLEFIESMLIPSFDPRYKLDTPEKRDDWMRDEAIATHWDEGISAELIKRFGTVDSLERAEKKLGEVKAEILLEKADEKERKQGAGPGTDAVDVICKEIGKEMTSSEVNCLFNNFSTQAVLLSQNRFTESIPALYRKIVAAVKSVTKKSVKHTGYYFDGPLPNAYGQDTNSLQYVHYHCQLLCAKIGARAVLRHEWSVSQSVHSEYRCPTVMCITTSLELSKDRLALVCPFYPATVAILPAGDCSLAMMCNVALCTIASIAAFRRVGLSHNDIKPANLMLTTTSQLVVLIDFGSAVKFSDGDVSKGTTAIWGRDCPAGSEAYDMACLASVMYYLQHGADQDDMGLQQLAEHVQSLPSPTIVDGMVLDCINRANEDVAVIFESWVAKVQLQGPSIKEGTIVDPSSIWPTPTG